MSERVRSSKEEKNEMRDIGEQREINQLNEEGKNFQEREGKKEEGREGEKKLLLHLIKHILNYMIFTFPLIPYVSSSSSSSSCIPYACFSAVAARAASMSTFICAAAMYFSGLSLYCTTFSRPFPTIQPNPIMKWKPGVKKLFSTYTQSHNRASNLTLCCDIYIVTYRGWHFQPERGQFLCGQHQLYGLLYS
jgi:hypothetical protein